ncbi:MAG: hypothetical protein AAFY24_21200, partial [Pseudomonadota bacterium]
QGVEGTDHRGKGPANRHRVGHRQFQLLVRPDGRTPAHSATVRSVFIIGPDKQLKLSMTYPMTVGRNFAEVVRALDALQMSSKGVATPANWNVGEDVIIPPSVNDDDARAKFGDFDAVLPYLRKIKAPA